MSEITRNPLCWPDNVPRTIPAERGRPLFSDRSLAAAVQHVLAEINRLNRRAWDFDDESVIISSNLRLRRDGMPSGEQANEIAQPGVAVYFMLRFWINRKEQKRHTVLTCDRWKKVSFNLIAIAKDIEAQRARERWGCTSVQQAFQGYLAIPERCGGKAWWDELGVKPDATLDQIKDQFRGLAKIYHPDVAGDATRDHWNKLQEAYDQALARFRT